MRSFAFAFGFGGGGRGGGGAAAPAGRGRGRGRAKLSGCTMPPEGGGSPPRPPTPPPPLSPTLAGARGRGRAKLSGCTMPEESCLGAGRTPLSARLARRGRGGGRETVCRCGGGEGAGGGVVPEEEGGSGGEAERWGGAWAKAAAMRSWSVLGRGGELPGGWRHLFSGGLVVGDTGKPVDDGSRSLFR